MDDSARTASTEELLSDAGWLRRFARRLTADADEAGELEQETWHAALTRPPKGARRPWLQAVATNLWRRRRRDALARRYHEERAASDEVADPEAGTLARLELQARVVAAVRSLPEPLRTAVTLRHLDGLAYDEVARRTGTSEVAARKRVSRGLDELRRRLDRAFGGRAAWGVLAFALGRDLPVPASITALATSGAAATAGAAGLFAGGVTMTAGVKIGLTAAAAVLLAGGILLLRRDDARAVTPERGGVEAAAPALVAAPDEPAELREDEAADVARVEIPVEPEAREVTDAIRTIDAVRGRVVDERGGAIAGATVVLLRFAGQDYETLDVEFSRREDRVADALTDGDGAFALGAEPGRRYAVRARIERDAAVWVSPARWAFAGEEIELVVSPGGVVAGQVLRPDDLPAIGARVELRANGEAGSRRLALRTDADGTFRADGLAPGEYRIGVTSSEGATPPAQNVVVNPGAEARVVLRLTSGLRLTGRVVDGTTGAPIAGARISETWTFPKWVTTDVDGRFEYDYPAEHYLDLDVDAEGYGRRSVQVFGMFGNEPVAEHFEIELAPAATVLGRLVDAAGEPIEGAYVACAGSLRGGDVTQTSWRATRSGADGRFRVEGVSTEMSAGLFLVADGFASETFELGVPTLDLDVGDVVMAPGATVVGRVVDGAGEPLAGRRVTLHGTGAERYTRYDAPPNPDLDTYVAEREARTDADGRYAFPDVPPGAYQVAATLPGLPEDERVDVAVAEDDRGGEVEAERITLSAGLAIEGRILDPDGNGVGTVFLNAFGGVPSMRAGVISQADGSFELVGLSPGTYTLEVAPLMASSGVEFARQQLSDVAAGTSDLVVRVAVAVELTGTVVDAKGDPVVGATVKMTPVAGSASWTQTDGAGRFSFTPPAGARVTLRAHPPGQRSDPTLPFQYDEDPERAATLEEVDPSAGEVVLRLP